jgi:hypothetical protein
MWWLALIVIAIMLIILKTNSSFTHVSEIPRIIWTYWDSDELPDIIQKSVENWKQYSPEYDVRVVTPKTLPYFLPEKDFSNFWPGDVVQRKVDLIRLYLVAKYGGIWSDASVVVKKNHSEIVGTGHDFMGYYREAFTKNKERPVIENWFFAAPQGSDFVAKWRDEFERSANFNKIQDYLNDVKSKGVDFQNMSQSNAEYMTPYISAQVVMASHGIKNMRLEKSDDGPFRHSTSANWDAKKAMERLCRTDSLPDMIKIYGNERRAVEADPSLKCMYKVFD